ncbi:hypothetical protein NUW58_g1908 [Xylaria curta]|uniref:Uncharacterized protein n=1 Tax=Xylaria curta TaxID=42375 RepID=A0ACC1PI33_9PEZI|nr:hypothetical protein NUW58_g1908 [Xylaria curta]
MPVPDTGSVTTPTGTSTNGSPPPHTSDASHDKLDPEGEDLSTGAFMSFEEWKAMMLAKQDSEIASSARPREQEKEPKEQVELVTYDEGFPYYRSKDAGTTSKERFSYSSFDAGATVKKTSPGAKNPTAILVENKDSYMLLECGTKNKFFIVELSDVILIDTVVIANFEFFSSMVRQFQISISDRYPVKLDKWKVLGTFEARNSRNIQPFLIENPQDWARYIRVEILSHYGNEYYCPVSLLRVHGLRMLDSWKQVDPSELEGEDESPLSISEPVDETPEIVDEPPIETEAVVSRKVENHTAIAEQSYWTPYWVGSYFELTFPLLAGFDERSIHVMPNALSATMATQDTESLGHAPKPGSSVSASVDRPIGTGVSIPTPSSPGSGDNTSFAAVGSSTSQIINENPATQNAPKSRSSASTSVKPPSSRSSAKASSGSQTTVRNKTSTATSSPPPTPTVQDSFFKALTKRLQILESNSTLSLQYIESQSRFLQEALAKLERRQIAKVDLFLDKLNNTVLGELREVRTLYDHIWQSTVIALESQREQTEHEIVALSTRVGVLADEVVFQKRMAIVQSVLLLGCLVLVIFSRGFAGSAVEAYYPSQFLMSSSRLASPGLPSTPKALLKGGRANMGFSEDQSSTHTTPARARVASYSIEPRIRVNDGRSSSRTPETRSQPGSKGTNLDQNPPPPTPNRALSDPSGLDFQPPTPSSIDDMAYDSEPAITPNGDYFSATTSVNGDSSVGGEGEEVSRIYPDDEREAVCVEVARHRHEEKL